MNLKSNKGFSLIEIMVTMAIVALIMGVAASALMDNKDQKISDTYTRLAAAIKMMFNEAAVKGQYFRLKIDFSQNTLTPEFSSKPFKISISEEDEVAQKPQPKSEAEGDSASAEVEESASEAPPSFSKVDSSVLKEIKIPEGYKIKNVFFTHLPQAIESGETALHFFPNGWVEKMILNLCDENEEVFYSLETFSASGKSKIRTVYTEPQWESVQ